MVAHVILFFLDSGLKRVTQLLSICSKEPLIYVLLDVVRNKLLPHAILLECLLDDFKIVCVFCCLKVLKAELYIEIVDAATSFKLLRFFF